VKDTPHPHVRPGSLVALPALAVLAVVSVLAFGGSRAAGWQAPGCGHDKFAPARPGVPAALHFPAGLKDDQGGAESSASGHARPCPPSSAAIPPVRPVFAPRPAFDGLHRPAVEQPACMATGPPTPPPRRS
jgi:hypothetical protein